MILKYSLGAVITIPLLPLLYLQGRRVKKSIPDLPEAKEPSGVSGFSECPKMKILIIGESTMAGVGVENHRDGFAGTLADELANKLKSCVHWTVHAKSGITVGRMSEELLIQIEDNDWDLVVVGIGGNDAFKLNNPIRWKSQIREFINQLNCRFPQVPIVFTNMPPIKEFPAFTPLMKWTIGNLVELLGEALDDVVGEFNQVYYSSEVISIENWVKEYNLSSDISLYFSDGVHPSQLTYQTLAKQLVEFIGSDVNLEQNL
ncbi:MAG: SGNH/GDSL hydrolase family protein [Reichenbachiella sp.]|uniref:SGNH/GDSL hydrolase family protein n=1 Tax=Reichenbachiella sp. TaxID=2184521 RepID=UPI003298B50D